MCSIISLPPILITTTFAVQFHSHQYLLPEHLQYHFTDTNTYYHTISHTFSLPPIHNTRTFAAPFHCHRNLMPQHIQYHFTPTNTIYHNIFRTISLPPKYITTKFAVQFHYHTKHKDATCAVKFHSHQYILPQHFSYHFTATNTYYYNMCSTISLPPIYFNTTCAVPFHCHQ